MKKLEQDFLKALDSKLWEAANNLRNNLDAANYKHVVLGIIFLKYVSDAFDEHQKKLIKYFQDKDHKYYISPDHYDTEEEYFINIENELEILEYYKADNVFWVPKAARWKFIKESASLNMNTIIPLDDGSVFKLTSVSALIDNALEQIENFKINGEEVNPKLKGILPRITLYQVENHNLTELINKFSDTSFSSPSYNGQQLELNSKDILGHVYEYFLGKFALAEGKKSGQFYTPKSIVNLIIEMLEPYQGRVYDPAMGAGGFFVSNDKFIESHADLKHYNANEQRKNIYVYGQESNPTTWRLAAMNMAIRGIDFNFGTKNADTFLDNQHPDLRADFVMANPPFNDDDWWHEKLQDDARWQYGIPPKGNANFAWIQHMLHHLNQNGSMGLLLANGSMSSNTNNEGAIRKNLIEADLVECMVALPGQLFTNTQIPACIWFLTKNKNDNSKTGKKNRVGKTLFIDARNKGENVEKVLKVFTDEDIKEIADTFHKWQQDDGYEDKKGFCYSASLEDIQKNDYVLTPGRYVGANEIDADEEPFEEKMIRLTTQLKEQLSESENLQMTLKKMIIGIGYEL